MHVAFAGYRGPIPALKVVVLGGYGHFGGVISRRLAGTGSFDVTVAGRNAAAAAALAAEIGAASAMIEAADPRLAERIAARHADLLISAAGPFQGQGYEVARACLAAGAHYIDIADGRDFVCGIAALDAEARARGLLVVSGASSVPALSGAVVDRYAGEFRELLEIDTGISSSATLPGAATTGAILGYCGRPIPLWRDGARSSTIALQGLRRVRFRDPPMTRWIADCDVPDLDLFPARYPTLRHLRFGAGTELTLVQWALHVIAGLVKSGIVRDLPRWSGALRRGATALACFGTHASAMFVELRGLGHDGQPHVRRWELRAEGDEGARVPCLAAVALARKLASGALPVRGAMPCVGLLTLEEYLDAVSGLRVVAEEVLFPL